VNLFGQVAKPRIASIISIHRSCKAKE